VTLLLARMELVSSLNKEVRVHVNNLIAGKVSVDRNGGGKPFSQNPRPSGPTTRSQLSLLRVIAIGTQPRGTTRLFTGWGTVNLLDDMSSSQYMQLGRRGLRNKFRFHAVLVIWKLLNILIGSSWRTGLRISSFENSEGKETPRLAACRIGSPASPANSRPANSR
jgi:hypothetical protein